MMKISHINLSIFASTTVSDQLLDRVADTFSDIPRISVTKLRIRIRLEDNFSFEEVFGSIEKIRANTKISEEEFLILLTDKTNASNWFSAFNQSYPKNIFIQTTDWDNFVYLDESLAVSSQIMNNILQSFIYESVELELIHGHPIGCINDFCGWKPDIQLKMKTGDICPECLNVLQAKLEDIVLRDVGKLLSKIRDMMVFHSDKRRQSLPDFETTMHTPFALTKRKISTTTDSLRKTLYAIDHFDVITKILIYYYLAKEYTEEDQRQFLNQNRLIGRIPLGRWVAALGIIGRNEEVFQKIYNIADNERIVNLRNKHRGHGYIDCCDRTYDDTFLNLNNSLTQIESLLMDLFEQYKLIRILAFERINNYNYKLKYNELTGSNLMLIEKTTITQNNLNPVVNRIYLADRNFSAIHGIFPYLIFDQCPQCKHDRLMIKDGQQYVDIYKGHFVQLQN